MACAIAREVRDGETLAVGTLAPIPASGALLAHFTHAPRATVVILNHPDFWPFGNGSKEFYDYAQRGKFDLFFLSGGQIDRHGNLNLITVGDHARPKVRFPGGAGAATRLHRAPFQCRTSGRSAGSAVYPTAHASRGETCATSIRPASPRVVGPAGKASVHAEPSQ